MPKGFAGGVTMDLFTPYKSAVTHWVETRSTEAMRALDTARKALCTALGYERVHDHLGEYCNLNERDIPGYQSAQEVSSLVLSAADKANGRVWSYSGWRAPVTHEELQSLLKVATERRVELEAWFMLPPAEKFIGGAVVLYRGLGEDGAHFLARFIKGRDMPSLRVERMEMFSSHFEMQPIMPEFEARNFFANLGKDAVFVKTSMSDQRGRAG